MECRRVDIFPQWVGSLLSIGLLCDHGLLASYSEQNVTISDKNGDVVLQGHRCPVSKLWLIDIACPQQNVHSASTARSHSKPSMQHPQLMYASPHCNDEKCGDFSRNSGSSAQSTTLYISEKNMQPLGNFLDVGKDDQTSITKLGERDYTNFMFSGAVITEARGTQSQIVAYYHKCMGAPAASTLIKAIDNLGLTLPGLTSAMVRRFPPVTTATPKGHMNQFQQGRRSTKPDPTKPMVRKFDEELESDIFPPIEHRESRNLHCTTKSFPSSDLRHHDLTGRFGVKGYTGAEYFMIMLCGNYIHIEALNSRCQADYVKAYARGAVFFEERGITPSFERMDNEDSALLDEYCKNHDPPIAIQHVPAHNHRGNKAERAIQTAKNHLISTFCVTDAKFPLYLFDKLIDQAELTLNLMRGSSFSPHVSAWQALNGSYNFSNTPIAPPGMKIVCFESPDQRHTWATHGVDGFYIGPALDHHRCYKVYITATRSIRTTGQLSWHPPAEDTLPGASPLDDVISCLAALRLSCDVLAKSHPAIIDLPQPNMPSIPNLSAAIDTLASLLSSISPSYPPTPLPLDNDEKQYAVADNTRSHDVAASAPRTQRVASVQAAPAISPATSQRVETAQAAHASAPVATQRVKPINTTAPAPSPNRRRNRRPRAEPDDGVADDISFIENEHISPVSVDILSYIYYNCILPVRISPVHIRINICT